jgi:hypothetical protein
MLRCPMVCLSVDQDRDKVTVSRVVDLRHLVWAAVVVLGNGLRYHACGSSRFDNITRQARPTSRLIFSHTKPDNTTHSDNCEHR